MDIGPFQANHLIDVLPRCTRYLGKSASIAHCEIRRLHFDWLSASERELWTQRLRLLSLVNAPGLRKLLAWELNEAEGFVALEHSERVDLSSAIKARELTLDGLLQMLDDLASSLQNAHRIGFSIGGFAIPNVFRSTTGSWQLDPLAPWTLNTDSRECLAPEFVSESIFHPAGDVFSLCSILADLLTEFKEATPLHREITHLVCQGTIADPYERTTLRELLQATRRLLLPASHFVSGSNANSASLDKTVDTHTANETPSVDFGTMIMEVDHDHQPPQLQMLGRFRLSELLGQGGMGAVYKGLDTSDQTPVAIKVLNEQRAGQLKSKRRFEKEARLLAKANNPYVANLLEFNIDGTVAYIAIEYVSGGALGSFLYRKKQFSEATAIALMLDVVRGLAIAHRRGVVHRDIKPDNLLLTDLGRSFLESFQDSSQSEVIHRWLEERPQQVLVKISDFGLASVSQTSESMMLTSEGSLLGTPLYMSPEQCRGEQADSRSDVYSLGMTLFHLLTGKPPFDGDSQIKLMTQHCQEPLPSLKSIRSELSDGLVRVIEKCAQKNPDSRYVDANELLSDLENLFRGEPTSLIAHPKKATVTAEVQTYEFTWDLASSPQQLWPYLSNTDRVNQSMGLPAVKYHMRNDPVKGRIRIAETRVAGQQIVWQEHPYEWIEGRRFSVLREFSRGPFEWFVNVVDIQPIPGGGTRLKQVLQIAPRNFLGKMLGKWELGRKSKGNFGRTYQTIDQYLLNQSDAEDPSLDPFGKRVELAPSKRALLELRLEQLKSRGGSLDVIETLKQFLLYASDLEVARLRPFAFADRFGLDRRAVANTFLMAARDGVLSILWDILCPTCRIPSGVQQTLAEIKEHGYCEACDVSFELDFARSVELVFKVHPEIRDVQVKTYCIGGPAWSAHVVAQILLSPKERFAAETALPEGSYRIRGPQLPFVIDFRVAPHGNVGRWEIPLSRPPARDSIPVLRIDEQVLFLVNDTARDLQVRIERIASRHDALTAAQATSLAVFRELFPSEVLSGGQIVSVESISLLLFRLPGLADFYRRLGDGPAFALLKPWLETVRETAQKNFGGIVELHDEGGLLTFTNGADAMNTAVALERMPNALSNQGYELLRPVIAVHSGPVLVTNLNDRLDYCGTLVQQSRALLNACRPGELLISDSISSLAAVRELATKGEYQLEIDSVEMGDSAIGATRWSRCK